MVRRERHEYRQSRREPNVPTSIAPRLPPAWLAVAFLMVSLTGCHKVRSLAGMGADPAATPAAAPADSSAKTKHLPNFGSGRKDRARAGEGPTTEPKEHAEASVSRHARRASAPFYHWDDAAPAPSRHRSRSGF
jgi:hypothetical protein